MGHSVYREQAIRVIRFTGHKPGRVLHPSFGCNGKWGCVWKRFASRLWNDSGLPLVVYLRTRLWISTCIAASAAAATTQMQIYCYSITQFGPACSTRTLILYNVTAGFYGRDIGGTVQFLRNHVLKPQSNLGDSDIYFGTVEFLPKTAPQTRLV